MDRKLYKETVWTRVFDVCNIVFMVLFSFCILYPFWNQLVLSLNEGKDAVLGGIYFWPRKFTLANYAILFRDSNLIKGVGISLLRVGVGVVVPLFCTGLMSYVVTRPEFKLRNTVRKLFIFTMYFGGGMIPSFILMVQLRLINNFWVYIIPGLIGVYNMLLMSSYMQDLPNTIFEAARIDGLNEFRIYVQILMPIAIPVFAAITIYLAVGHWNSWFDVLIYNPDGKWDTLQVYLRRILLEVEAFAKIENASKAQAMFRNMAVETVRAATTMVVTIPILVVYPFMQKYFIGGLTIGSVKG